MSDTKHMQSLAPQLNEVIIPVSNESLGILPLVPKDFAKAIDALASIRLSVEETERQLNRLTQARNADIHGS